MGHAYRPFDWYETPLYYDIIFDADTPNEARFVEAMYDRHVGHRGRRRIVEPACGSGRLLAPLARKGFDVAGFDLSAPMIDFARKRLQGTRGRVDLSVQAMESFRYRQHFDLGFCFVSTFKYLLTETAARDHLRCMAEHLRPGGVYLLGFHLTDYTRRTKERERWVARRGRTHVVCNIQSWPASRKARTERVRSRLVVTTGRAAPARYETSWTFRTYDHGEFKRLLRKVPELEIAGCHDFYYDPSVDLDFDEEPAGVIVVLRRRARGRKGNVEASKRGAIK